LRRRRTQRDYRARDSLTRRGRAAAAATNSIASMRLQAPPTRPDGWHRNKIIRVVRPPARGISCRPAAAHAGSVAGHEPAQIYPITRHCRRVIERRGSLFSCRQRVSSSRSRYDSLVTDWSVVDLHNITYSLTANCQTAVVHKNKTKHRAKLHKSQYNILTVKLQSDSIIREMRSASGSCLL